MEFDRKVSSEEDANDEITLHYIYSRSVQDQINRSTSVGVDHEAHWVNLPNEETEANWVNLPRDTIKNSEIWGFYPKRREWVISET